MIKDETVGSKDIMKHPGPIIMTDDIKNCELQRTDVVSGTFARTFKQVSRMMTTTRGGPPIGDIHRRTVWSLSKGKVIHDCIVDDTSDYELNR